MYIGYILSDCKQPVEGQDDPSFEGELTKLAAFEVDRDQEDILASKPTTDGLTGFPLRMLTGLPFSRPSFHGWSSFPVVVTVMDPSA